MTTIQKTLLVTQDFPPLTGGVANYYYNRVKKMPSEKVAVLMDKVINYQLLITNYSFKIYYKNFFTKLIWPHWLPLIWHIYKTAKKEKIDMLWVGQVLPIGSAVYIISKLLKIPYIVTCHGNDLLRAKSVPRKFKLAKKILQNAEYVEANTKFTQQILIKDFGFGEDKIHPVKSAIKYRGAKQFDRVKIVYPECSISKNMVDKNKVQELREKYNLKDKKVLLTVARLVKSKGVDQVIKALPKVLEKIPDLVYIIVGDGPEKNNLKNMANDVGTCHGTFLLEDQEINKNIIFTGNIPFKELVNYYALADLFILTPRKVDTDTESYGIVYLEAKEFDLPVIAGDVGGVREIDYNKITLVDSENINEISNKIVKLLNC